MPRVRFGEYDTPDGSYTRSVLQLLLFSTGLQSLSQTSSRPWSR